MKTNSKLRKNMCNKEILLSLMLICTVFTAYSQKKEVRQVSGFSGISASSVFEITVTKGNTESLTVEADDAVMPYVRSEVKKGVLHLYLDNGNKKLSDVKNLKAYVVMKNLDNVSLSGACKLTSKDQFTPDQFKGDCSGASNMDLNLKANKLDFDMSGASSLTLNAEVAGEAEWDLSGSSKIQARINASKVSFSTSGLSNVELSGSCNKFDIETSGTSTISAFDFAAKTAFIESSGTSKLELNVTEKLKVESSGASTITYKGSPIVEQHNSGASKIKKYTP